MEKKKKDGPNDKKKTTKNQSTQNILDIAFLLLYRRYSVKIYLYLSEITSAYSGHLGLLSTLP